MSHEITNRDGVFTVREAAWHGLGHTFADYPTRAEAQAVAHPWEPVAESLFRVRRTPGQGGMGPGKPALEKVEGYVLNTRSDDGGELGIVPTTYVTVTNNEMYDIAETVQGEDSDVKLETGGSLKGGKKVWLLLRLNEPLLVPGDPHGETIAYYALQNAHDGSGAFRGQGVNERIVCANTAHIADVEASAYGTEFVFRHTKNVRERIEEARTALAGWRSGLERWQLECAELIAMKVTPEATDLFLERFIPMPMANVVTDRVIGNIEQARAEVREVLGSQTCVGIEKTAYGLVQASIEWTDHVRRAHSQESRFTRSYLERSSIVRTAVTLAVEAANA
jgi:phage/plasmid-like protein (TIGR03299 family)